MAWRLRLAPEKTNINFFKAQWLTFGGSALLMVLSIVAWAVMGLNYGIDFKGGTTLRTESAVSIDTGAYRSALEGLGLGDVAISEVFDPAFGPDQHVASIRLSAEEGDQVTEAQLASVRAALVAMEPTLKVISVETVGPKVSGELVTSSLLAVAVTSLGILAYIWMRFEWQFAVGGVVALLHDVIITVGIFAVFQLKFDLTIVAALLTTLGYSINDTVVVFDRLRENLIKYKTMPLRDVMNLSVNETLGRTLATAMTTLLAVGSMLVFGGDVIRGFSFAIFAGIILGTYSSVYVAKNLVLFIGLDRSEKPKGGAKGDHEFANIDA
ncbi:protein translocase subunit SecF [Stagnihabitans tardus]|uniref:Protein-export membrane protein SecF n=1 Tax=Stagnihabitans tardus TaxID=2699202 RepID=A0AAE5BT55_9RHOB|nr:protein translocase subunit SecF [Stagnihabitans tardus]NBZ86256.1 protein translocase subunit SecF [Stagnihabitans tardus]